MITYNIWHVSQPNIWNLKCIRWMFSGIVRLGTIWQLKGLSSLPRRFSFGSSHNPSQQMSCWNKWLKMQSNHSPPPDMGGALLTLKNLTTYLWCKTPKKGQLSQKRSPKKGKAPGFLRTPELNSSFSRRSWGRKVWQSRKDVCVEG